MIKKLVVVLIAFIAMQSNAQEGTESPYSYFGIGTINFKGTVENRSMGGLSIYCDSIHINLKNPASYGGENLALYNYEGRPIKFAIAGGHKNTKLKSTSSEDRIKSSTFDYISLALPFNKLGVGLGIMPYTNVGYKFENYNQNGDLATRYRGEGGLNKVYFSLGYQVLKGLRIGADVNYNFGNIEGATIAYVRDTNGDLTQYQTRENNRSDIHGYNVNLGIHFQTNLTKYLELTSAITFQPRSNLKSKNKRSINSIRVNSATEIESVVNTIDIDLEAQGLKNTELKNASNFSFGLGLGVKNYWFIGVESAYTQSEAFNNPLYYTENASYEDGTRFSIGGFYIPDYNSYNRFYKRMVYRAGFRTQKSGLVINDESIKEFGISFGLGIPLGNAFSNVNLGFEIGKRGTKNKNLIQENFFNFQLSLSLNDRWFQKRKYD